MEVLSVTNVKYNNQKEWEYEDFVEPEESALIEGLSKRLEEELRMAKRTHLTVGEVLLPHGLTRRVAQEIFILADSEPCGLKGCTLYINFEGEKVNKKLCTIECDMYTPSTFELYLTFKESTAGWNSFLPQFLKKITRGGTVMISPEYDLQKKKLYRSQNY